MSESTGAIVATKAGKLEGINEGGLYIFKGIPYAEPPVGVKRWQPPEPVKPWQAVREAKTIAGWIQALTVGRPDFHPTTLEFFRNTLLSGGIFTALFVGSLKLTAAESPAEKRAGAREEEPEVEPETEEAKT